MTSGSATFTTSYGQIGCGDIGQAIQVNGAGPSGTNLVATIASVSPCWSYGPASGWQTVTLTASASTTVTNAHSYISVLGLPVTTTIGNCAIGMDDKDAKSADWVNPGQSIGSAYPTMENVTFTTANGSYNNVCGLYTQGQWALYGPTVNHFNFFNQEFALVQGASELNSYYASNSGDFETWNHGLFTQNWSPWISYNGIALHWQDIEMTTQTGPQFLQLGNQWSDVFGGALISGLEFETFGSPATTYGARITGLQHTLNNATIGSGSLVGTIDANNTTCTVCGGATIQLYGSGNVLIGQNVGTTVRDSGYGNSATGSYNSNPFHGLPLDAQWTFLPMKGNPSVVGSSTADFLHDGNPSIPYKWNDLFIWPQDIQPLNNGGATPYSSYFVADSASPTGGEFIMAQNAGYGQFQQYLYGGGNGQLNVTKNLPAIQMTLYFSAKCPSGQTSFTFLAGIFGGSYTNTQSYSCTTSLQTYSLVQNLVGQTTGYFYFENTSAFSIYLAWAALVPTPNFPAGTTIGGNPVGTGTVQSTSVGNLSPLFTSSVATPTTAPAITYSLSNAAQNAVLAGPTSGAGAPTHRTLVAADIPSLSSTYCLLTGCTHTGQITISNAASPTAAISSSTTGATLNITSTLATSGGGASIDLTEGASSASAVLLWYISGTDYWRLGMSTSTNFVVRDELGGKVLVNFPSNTMPVNSIGGNANGATAITQAASDNSVNIATDAFVNQTFRSPGPPGVSGAPHWPWVPAQAAPST